MCGVNGIFKWQNVTNEDVEKVEKMNKDIAYRGPDGSGIFHDDKCVLGHVRLSIVDLDNGQQPMYYKSYVIVFNGEIYNHEILRNKLIEKGHIFNTHSDTEVILHLFEESRGGGVFLNELIGMYAFAIYDKEKQELFLARDVCGEKPLYYAQTPDGFIFSSEIKTIAQYYLNKPVVDYKELHNFLDHSFSQTLDKTFIQQIKRVEPAQYVCINMQDVIFKRYWKKTNTYDYKGSYEDAKKECMNILRRSVKMTIADEVPVAVLLSGGIDSTTVAALMKENLKEVHAFTLGFKGKPIDDERERAKRFAEEKGLIYHEIEVDEKDYEDSFKEVVKYLDEPLTEISLMNKFILFRECKKMGFKVVLSGTGGDELFYGYPRGRKSAENMENLAELVKASSIKRKFKRFLKFSHFCLGNKKYNFLDDYGNFALELPRMFGYETNLNNSVKFAGDDGFYFNQNNYRNAYYDDEKYPIDKVYSYLFNVFLNHCFHFDDKMSMANSIEFRNPLCSRELIDFISSLPLNYKWHKENLKGFLKDVLRENNIVPDYILDAKKNGLQAQGNLLDNFIKNNSTPKVMKGKLQTYGAILLDRFLYEKAFLKDSI